MKDAVQRMFKHMHWADEQVLAGLRGPGAIDEAFAMFSHVLAGELIWYSRLVGEDISQLEVFPKYDVETCASRVEQLKALYRTYLRRADEKSLAETITYRNTEGDEFENVASDILIHVALHGSYHRGQIASRVRVAGGDPAITDFIWFCREGL